MNAGFQIDEIIADAHALRYSVMSLVITRFIRCAFIFSMGTFFQANDINFIKMSHWSWCYFVQYLVNKITRKLKNHKKVNLFVQNRSWDSYAISRVSKYKLTLKKIAVLEGSLKYHEELLFFDFFLFGISLFELDLLLSVIIWEGIPNGNRPIFPQD